MCREAREAGSRSDDAAEKFVSAELEGGYWLKPLKDASDYWAMESARRLIEAYAAAEEALGAERAVGFAIRGETWLPFDLQEEAVGALLRGGAPLAAAFDEAEALHALRWPVWGRRRKVEVDEVGAAMRGSGMAGVPDGAVAGEMGQELHHRNLRAVFGGEPGEAIGALSRAAAAGDAHDDRGRRIGRRRA